MDYGTLDKRFFYLYFFLFNLFDLFSNLSYFVFCRTVAFVGRFFVGRWVAMVLTSSSCNLGIDYFDNR